MAGRGKRKQTVIRWLLGAALVIDLLLATVNWRMVSTPRGDQTDLNILKRERDLMVADSARGVQIRAAMPGVERQCDTFLKDHLPPVGAGYSAVLDNLGAVAREAGLHTEDVNFKQHDPDKRGIVLVEIGTTVNGDYSSVVRFINGLEHSDNFYVLDDLALAAGSGGNLKLNLRLRTYFRT